MIQFRGVAYSYPGVEHPHPAVSDLDFSVAPGEMVALVGANGSGKSTVARLCNGLLNPTRGAVTVDDMPTSDQGRAYEVRGAVGMVFQNPDDQIVATSVEDEVAFGPENLGCERAAIRARVDRALAQVGLSGLERREPHLLSGGQKQRLAIAAALAMGGRYLVLDEPLSMIDPEGRRAIRDVLAQLRGEGCGVLHITHDVAEALRCDRVVVLADGGKVWEGDAQGLLGQRASFERWGIELPEISRLVSALGERGAVVRPSAVDPSEVAEALCRSF